MPAPTSSERPSRIEGGGSPLALVGLLVGIWAILPPYIGAFGKLNVTSRVEVADHVIPGVLVVALCAFGFLLLRSPAPSALLLFVIGGVITLAGFWMLATHVGLVTQARQRSVPWGAVIWHGLPGLVVLLLGVAWTIRFWDSDEDEAPSGH